MSKQQVVVLTSGPTYEELDEVRRITNHSTGKLGAELSCFFKKMGFYVILLRGSYATDPSPILADEMIQFTTTQDLALKLQNISCSGNRVDWVFHAAAVSDFKPGRFCQISESGEVVGLNDSNSVRKNREGKIDTRQGSFWVEMIPTEKIIQRLREWFPNAKLVGWKYEVEGDHGNVWQKAKEQVEKCQTDASVANGPAFGPGFGIYWANGDRENLLENSQALAKALYDGFTPNANSVSK